MDERSTLPSLSSRANDILDLVPVSRAEFAAEVSPCLTLVAGVGMTADDQTTWLKAAYRALDGIPIRLLRRGSAAAMQTADHPSKIVPAIIREVREDWEWRKRRQPTPAPTAPEPLAIEDNTPLPFEEVAAMPRQLQRMGLTKGWVTQADYDRLGAQAEDAAEAA